jgi:hypothetical protein
LELGRLVEEDVSLEPVRDGVLDLVGGEFAGRDVEQEIHFLQGVAGSVKGFLDLTKELRADLERKSLGFRDPEDNHDECKNVQTGLLKEIVENRVN